MMASVILCSPYGNSNQKNKSIRKMERKECVDQITIGCSHCYSHQKQGHFEQFRAKN